MTPNQGSPKSDSRYTIKGNGTPDVGPTPVALSAGLNREGNHLAFGHAKQASSARSVTSELVKQTSV